MVHSATVMWRVNVHRAPSISPGEAEFYALTNTITQTEIGQVGGENWRLGGVGLALSAYH